MSDKLADNVRNVHGYFQIILILFILLQHIARFVRDNND